MWLGVRSRRGGTFCICDCDGDCQVDGLGAAVVVVRYDIREDRVGRQLRQVLKESFMVIGF